MGILDDAFKPISPEAKQVEAIKQRMLEIDKEIVPQDDYLFNWTYGWVNQAYINQSHEGREMDWLAVALEISSTPDQMGVLIPDDIFNFIKHYLATLPSREEK